MVNRIFFPFILFILLMAGCGQEDVDWGVSGNIEFGEDALTVSLYPERVAAGMEATIVVQLHNDSDWSIDGWIVTLEIPEFLIDPTFLASQGSFDKDRGLWSLGPVGASASSTLTVSGTVGAGHGGEDLRAIAAVVEPDLATDLRAERDFRVFGTDLKLVKVSRDSTPPAIPYTDGRTPVEYLLRIANQGLTEASGIVVVDTLPAELEYHGVVDNDPRAFYSLADHRVEWNLGALAVGATDSLSILAIYPGNSAVQVVTNTARITALQEFEENWADNWSDARVRLDAIDLEIAAAIEGQAPVIAGGPISYIVELWNRSGRTATNVVIGFQFDDHVHIDTALPPSGTTFLPETEPRNFAWYVPIMMSDIQEPLRISVSGDVSDGAANEIVVLAVHIMGSDQMDPEDGNDLSAVPVVVLPSPAAK